MAFGDDLKNDVDGILRTKWSTRDGRKVPEAEDVTLGNDAVKLDATVLYADMSGSTALVDGYKDWFAAEVYKAYLHCAAKIVSSEGGVITAYDGDRIMAVFIGDSKNSTAARCGLKINYAVKNIINPCIEANYPKNPYKVQHVVGIDTSSLFAARTGIRGANDLVWVGRAANHAAKLTELPAGYATRITQDVYKKLNEDSKYSKGKDMWEEAKWTAMNDAIIYRSTYWWKV
jgi:class 3 adenylate cyclase